MKRKLLLPLLFLPLAGCPIETHNVVEIQQQKPLEANLNVHIDTINIVVDDARKDMQGVTGETPLQVVNPESVGLPPKSPSPSPGQPSARLSAPEEGAAFAGPADVAGAHDTTLTLAVMMPDTPATEESLKNNISGRIPQVRYVLDAHVVGEAASGLLAAAPGAKLTPEQTAILTAENKDRSALYALVVKRTGKSLEDVQTSYYLAHLGYAKPGELYQKYNPDKKVWEWTTWPPK